MSRRREFWEQVDKSDGCWIWSGAFNGGGYGCFGRALAHRYAYELCMGPIPEGLDLDHLCRVRKCVNPAHLEPVTRAENVRRGLAPSMGGDASSARAAERRHCSHGHPWDAKNTYLWRGTRRCRECNLRTVKERAARARVLAGIIPYWERTHCRHGHEWTAGNTRVLKSGSRVCKECQRAAMASHRARLSDAP
jgi:hypothetical protein